MSALEQITVKELDEHMEFLADEMQALRAKGKVDWAMTKAHRLESIREVLRKIRQDKQMTGPGGKRIA